MVDRVTGDFSRLIPDEKIQETTIDYKVTAESFTVIIGTAVSLANKPIKHGSEVIKQSGTTYVRDTDYTMDYANGTVNAISGGGLSAAAATADYDKSRIALDLTGLTDMLLPSRIEWPVGDVPQSFNQYYIFAGILWVTAAEGESQSSQADKDHIRVYYFAEHTAPTDSANGSFPRFLDEVMVNGVIAYALAMKSREQNLQSIKDGDSAARQLLNASGAFASAEAALNELKTSTTGPYAKITAALDGTTTPLADINTALDKVESLIGTAAGKPTFDALAKVATHTGEADTALDKVGTHTAEAGKALDKIPTHTSRAEAALDEVTKHSSVKAPTALDKVATHSGTEADAALDKVTTHTDEAGAALGKVATHTGEAGTELDKLRPIVGHISAAATANGGKSTKFTSTAHGLSVGDIIDIFGTGDSTYDSRFVVAAKGTNDFTVSVSFTSDLTGDFRRESPVFDAVEALDKVDQNNTDANTALDQVATFISAATNSLTEALDKIPSAPDFHALADTALDKVATFLELVHKTDASAGDLKSAENTWTFDDPGIEDFLVDDVGSSTHVDSGAEEYLQAGDGLIDKVNLGDRAAELNQEYALASIEIAKAYADRRKDFLAEADRHTAQANTYIREAEGRMLQVSRYLSEAAEWAVGAQAFISESQSRNEMSARLIEESSQRHAAAQVALGAAAERNNMSTQYVQEAQARRVMTEAYVDEANQRNAMSSKFIDEAGGRNAISAILVAEAEQHNAIAQILSVEAGQRNEMSQAYVAEARERNAMSASYINEARQYIDGAQAYIAEAQTRVLEVRTYFDEAKGWQSKGELYLSEADHWLSEAVAYFRQSAGFRDLATQRGGIADRLKLDADDRHRDYWSMLTSRVQQAKQRSQASVRQWSGSTRPDNVSANL